MTKETLKDYFAILPECLRSCAYVVGGAATDLELAVDVDIVLLSALSAKEIQEKIDLCCTGHADKIMESGPEYNTAIRGQVCNILTKLDKHIHLMVSDCPCIENILGDFDLSVHQFAFNAAGDLFKVATSTHKDAPIEVIRFNSPDSTLKRYFRLSKRYGLPLNQNTINSLRYLISEDEATAKKRNEEVF